MTAALCDTFGFALSGLSSAEHALRAESHAKQAAAERAWSRLLPAGVSPLDAMALLPDRTAACSPKIKNAIREGVPASLRVALWSRLSGADALAAAEDEHYYATTCKAAGVHGLLLTQLEADLSMTSPPHPMLYTRRALEAVRRIVMAYGHRNPEVGYNPLLGGLTVYLLAVLGLECEVEAFWLLTAMVERVLPPTYFEVWVNKPCLKTVFVASSCDHAVVPWKIQYSMCAHPVRHHHRATRGAMSRCASSWRWQTKSAPA